IVTIFTPASTAASSTRRRLLVPARWPKRRGWPRRAAQRPLPSMMMATWWGTRLASINGCPSTRSGRTGSSALACLDGHDLGLLLVPHAVGLGDETVGQALELLLTI